MVRAMAIAVITGANRGIGLQLARKLAARHDEVWACCRTPNPELEEVQGVRVVPDIDVTDERSLRQLREALDGVDVDILINNAGILHVDGLGNLDPDSLRRQFEVNAVAPLMVTRALLDRLTKPGAKVAIITSRMGSIADNGSGGMYGYRMSKAAVNAAGKSLAIDLKGDGIAVAILHPGYVKTDMTSQQGTVHPADAARGLIERIDGLTLETTGTFWHMSGEELPW